MSLPLQSPVQPLNTLPPSGVSKMVNVEPLRTSHVQSVPEPPPAVEPQSISVPGGSRSGPVTTPLPVVRTLWVTESVLCDVPGPPNWAVTVYSGEPVNTQLSPDVDVQPSQL
jgi:hypothetical protein